jgi:glutamyl-tRNA synthetase
VEKKDEKSVKDDGKDEKKKRPTIGNNLLRWYQNISSTEVARKATDLINQFTTKAKPVAGAPKSAAAAAAGTSGSLDIPLPDAEMGKVVTRFAPEPSGYLHIGHAKAALLSEYFARQYKGKLILRFDDTNPSKEKEEFEQSIKEDLHLMGIKADQVTHTSDYFAQLQDYAIQLIKKGLAYVDDTDTETMRDQRMHGIASKNRDLSVEENLQKFQEILNGTTYGLTACLRAKMSVDDPNKALRDPVIYRCNVETPHHIHGTRYKAYPTYDFAAPVVDSLEGVTHALRANEYRDRNPQYKWFFDALNIRPCHIWDYSRMNFVYTLLSKRKLKWFVEEGLVSGWDDARFPTVRGIRRRGMTIEALRTYVLMQGASQKTLDAEWDKIWVVNKKVIDPIAPRFTALAKTDLVPVDVVGAKSGQVPKEAFSSALPRHKKNPDVGTKEVTFSDKFWLEQVDAASVKQAETVTLMDWGNVIIESIERQGDVVKSIKVTLDLDGDFKTTEKKLTWLSRVSGPKRGDLIDVTLLDYDYLITKKKLEEEDEVKDFLTPVTEFKTTAVGDWNLRSLKHGDIIQLERKGYYIVDRVDASSMDLISIPDGKVASTGSKASSVPVEKTTKVAPAEKSKAAEKSTKVPPPEKPTKVASPEKSKQVDEPTLEKPKEKMAKVNGVADSLLPEQSTISKMYVVPPVYGHLPLNPTQISKMYHVPSIYGDQLADKEQVE